MITPANLIIELNDCVNALVMINSKLDNLRPSMPNLKEKIAEVEDEYILHSELLPEIFQMVAKTKPDPKLIGTKLKDSITLSSAMLRKLTRLKKSL